MTVPPAYTRFAPLAVAGLVLVSAVGWSLTRSDAPAPAPTATASPSGLDALEARVKATPEDGDAWMALGVARFDLEKYADAATAFERAAKIVPDRATAWSSLGEALVMASERDPMPPPALVAFRKAAELDPKDPRARYFLAVQRDIGGDHEGAIGDWLALLKDTPSGAPWESDLKRTIEQVGKIHKIEVAERMAAVSKADPHQGFAPSATAAAGIPGPSPEQMRAAAALPPGQQDQMVQGMVASLEAKLKADPSNVDGWIMLMRSRQTLGETAKAKAALASARAANPGAQAKLDAAAATLGLN